MSIRNQILTVFSLLLILALSVPYIHFRSVITGHILEQTKGSAQKQLRLLIGVLSREDRIKDDYDLQVLLQAMGKDLNLRLSYISREGQVIADSGVSWNTIPELEDHSNRPEVREALAGKTGRSIRYSQSLHTRFMYLAQATPKIGTLEPGILRLAMPYSQVSSLLRPIHLDMLVVASASILLSIGLSWLLARRISNHIGVLSRRTALIGDNERYVPLHLKTTKELNPLVSSVNALVERVNQDFAIISRQKMELEAVLDNLGEGILLFDEGKKVRLANKALQETALISGSPVGRKPLELIRSLALDEALDRCIASPQDLEPLELKITIPGQRFFECRIVSVRSVVNDEQEFLVVLKEVTEQKRLEQMRKDFVANVSHELKTPLTSIKGYAEAILEGPAGKHESVQGFMQIILKNAGKMDTLIQDLLQLAKLESLQERIKSGLVDLPSAINRAWEICAPLAEEREVVLNLRLPEGRTEVISDHDQLVRVLVNLIENALKYGPHGQTISIRAEAKRNHWVVAVEDQGPGIPASIQGRVFERFFKAEVESSGSRTPGSGLGLSICKHILENQGGQIWVQSPATEHMEGTIFFFSLPRHA
ncbi:MAG: cell wall metabolism sensor histidine kinase WalK [Desulfohalobiaceae bacterium]|nr:cell wall metabolism sensor histidine kinase WalK [Desulfohalobiaceae bacterium]